MRTIVKGKGIDVSQYLKENAEKRAAKMDRYFREFLQGLSPEEEKAECLLPVLVDRLITAGQMTVSVLHTDAVWFGVTYQEDRPVVEQALKSLHDQGVYPPSLKE